MSIESLNASFVLIIPDLHQAIVGSGDQVRLVTAVIIVDAIDSFLVTLKREVRCVGSELPDFHCSIQRCTSKCVVVLRVEHNLHDVVRMSFEDALACPHLVPVPQLNQHVITARENQWLCRVDSNASNVICMCFERVELFQCVVVEDSHLKAEATGSNDE